MAGNWLAVTQNRRRPRPRLPRDSVQKGVGQWGGSYRLRGAGQARALTGAEGHSTGSFSVHSTAR